MVRFCLLVAVLALSFGAQAQSVYRWADSEGGVHYTDDPGTIPKGATVFATEGEPISEMGAPPVVRKPVEPQPVRHEAKPSTLDPGVPSMSEQFWRDQFRGAKEKIHNLEDEILSDRHKVEDPGGLPVSGRYWCNRGYGLGNVYGGGVAPADEGAQGYVGGNCMMAINPEYQRAKDRIERNRKALERAKEEFRDLERRASFEAVPNEWRR